MLSFYLLCHILKTVHRVQQWSSEAAGISTKPCDYPCKSPVFIHTVKKIIIIVTNYEKKKVFQSKKKITLLIQNASFPTAGYQCSFTVAYGLSLFTFTTEILSSFHPTLIFLLTAHLQKIVVRSHYVLTPKRHVIQNRQKDCLAKEAHRHTIIKIFLAFI